MRKQPLHDAVDNYLQKHPARFHMPGHKGAMGWEQDITEVEGCDSLYEASGPILELEQRIADCYGSGAALLSAGGATLCIQTMLALCGPGAKIIVGRQLHRSAVNGMALMDQQPVWIYPTQVGGYPGRYSPTDVEHALQEHPDAAAVYITSPDYFGVINPIREIAKVCHAYGKHLLVDNAHGAHLCLFDLHPISQGADMTADSLHKTLPAKTGGAVLHLAQPERFEEARRRMALFGSTSPSYPIMLSCEFAVNWAMEKGRAAYAKIAEQFRQIHQAAADEGFQFPLVARDPARLTLDYGLFGVSDQDFGYFIREQGLEPEYVGGGRAVFMGTPFNAPEDFESLCNAIHAFPAAFSQRHATGVITESPLFPQPEQRLSLRCAAFSASVECDVQKAVGQVAAQETAPCPPGIPILMPGEHITQEMVSFLKQRGVQKIRVVTEPLQK